MSGLDQVPTYQSINLLLVYFGSVDLSFLDACNCVGLTRLVIIENHLPHQHHQLMQVLPWLQHKVTRVAGHWHKHIHILTRLKEEEEENEVSVGTVLQRSKHISISEQILTWLWSNFCHNELCQGLLTTNYKLLLTLLICHTTATLIPCSEGTTTNNYLPVIV